jgi:hypothetical protein
MADGAGRRGDLRRKSQELAAYLKKHQVERTSGACPWGCGRQVLNGGPPLLVHLNFCTGSQRQDRRRKEA